MGRLTEKVSDWTKHKSPTDDYLKSTYKSLNDVSVILIGTEKKVKIGDLVKDCKAYLIVNVASEDEELAHLNYRELVELHNYFHKDGF